MRTRLAGLIALTAGAAFAFPNPDGGCSITTAGVLPQAVRGFPISYTVSTAGCTAPMRFIEVRQASLPPGMSLRYSGTTATISGTPDTAGVFTFSVRAIDSGYRIPSKSFVVKVNDPPQIDTPAAATGAAGVAYTDTIRARGGVAPYTFSVVEGALPSGLTLTAATGVISGTMPATGAQFRVRVTDSSSVPKTAERPFTIVPGGQITTVTAPPAGTVGTAYSFDVDGTLGASGFAQVLGSLPAGLTIDTNGLISGTPSAAGEFHFTVRQTAGTTSVWRSYRILVNGAGAVSGVPPSAEEQAAYEHVFAASGGVAPYTFSVSAGTLPTGITLDGASGALLGELPLGVAGSAFTISALDATGRTYSQAFSIARVFRLQGSSVAPPTARVNQNVTGVPMYSLTQGGATKSFEYIGGQGLGLIFLDPVQGTVSYQISTPGSFRPVIMGTDELGGAVVLSTSSVVVAGPLAISSAVELPNTRTFVTYNQTVPVVNGVFTPLNFTVSSGSLPNGLFLNAATGAITGAAEPGQSGFSFPFTITVSDAAGQTASRDYFIGVGGSINITSTFVPGGTTGSNYNVALAQSGPGAAIWNLQSGSLPPGVNLSGAGVLSGSPTTPGQFTFLVQATPAAASDFDAKQFTIHVAAPLSGTMSPASPAEAQTGSSVAALLNTVGGRAPFSIAVSGGGLPDGLYIQNTSPLGIQGVPHFEETRSFILQVTDADSRFASVPYTINVRKGARMDDNKLAPATRTQAYSQTLTATGGLAPYTWSLSAGVPPTGLTLSPGGVLSGTPTTNGTFNFAVLLIDVNGTGDERNFSMEVTDPIAITNAVPLPAGQLLTPYSTQITTTGGASTKVYSIASGDLPPLVAINPATGLVSTLPLLSGTYNFVVRATDSQGRTGNQNTQITIGGGLTISPATVPNGTIGTPYSQTLTAAGTSFAVSWSVTAGALPAGLTLAPTTGVISGTPTTAGAFNFTVQAIDSLSQVGSQAYSMTVTGVLTLTPATVPNGTVGTAYNQALGATGAVGAVSWVVSTGALPAGLTLGAASGIISGTPTAAGVFPFTVQATDSLSQTGSRAYTITVTGVLSISPATLPAGSVGTAYSQTLTASNNPIGAVVWTLQSGALPPGLSLGQTGAISGAPTTPGTFGFTVLATDSIGQTGQATYSVPVSSTFSINPLTIPAAVIGVAYSQTLTATGAIGSVAWNLVNSTLPTGLTLNPTTGVISGTVSAAAGTYVIQVQATDSQTQTAQRQYDLLVQNPSTITPPTLPDGTLGTAYNQTLVFSGASAGVTWAVSSGALPGGITLGASTGTLSGTPAATGSFSFVISAGAAGAPAATRSYTLTVRDPLTISTLTLPDGTEQEAYTATLATNSAATIPVTWSITAGVLPAGLALSSAGVISGVPTASGTANFTVRASVAGGQTATQALSILVVPVLTITAASLGEAPQGRAYLTNLTAAGGRTPYAWSLNGTSLPTGIALASTGVVAGTTNVAPGQFPQNIVVTDARGRVASKTLLLTVTEPPPPSLTISPDTIPNGRVGQAYSASFSGAGGTPGYSFSVVQGNPPPGLVLSGGALTGSPTQEGTFRFTVNVTDANGRVAGNQYTVVIEPALVPLSVTPSSIAPAVPVGQPATLQFGATGGKAPYTFAFSGNTPPGMSSNSSGLLSGTPSQGGTFTFNVEATDALQGKASRAYTLNVTGDLTITTQPPLAEGTVGTAYSVTFGVAGGRAPFTWSITGQTPGGLTFANGTLAGTPTAAGTFPFTVEVRDSQRLTATASFSITIFERLEITNGPADTPLLPGQAFNFAFATRGGKAPVVFAVSGGALPPGLSLNAGGTITGTPTTPGSSAFTVQATDALGTMATRAATLRVVAALTVTTTTLPSGTVGVDYSSGVAAAGGVAPLGAWSISAGALPAGLTLASDGTISGTPTAAGTASFTVRITDAAGTEATRALSISIALPPVPPISLIGLPQTLPPGTQTNITIQLARAFPVAVTGTLTLVFEPNAVNNADDPAVQFSSGGRTVTFTIPAGQTAGTFPVTPLRILSGTVAGTIRIRTATSPDSATPVPEALVPVSRSVPVITAGTAQLGTGTFTLQIDGFSNTREISAATVRLTAAPGAPLTTTDVPVSVAGAFTAYYQSAAAAPFGGQFRLVLPFNVAGALNDIESATITVTNSVGTSLPLTVRLR